MVNLTALRERVNDSGMKLAHLAKQVGITRQALSYKLNGKRSFSMNEASHLGKALYMTDEEFIRIFFASEVE